MKRQSHSDGHAQMNAMRAELRSDPTNLDLANRVWALLSGATGFDVRTGSRAIEVFRNAALHSDAGLSALVSAFRSLADETGEHPRVALFDPLLGYSLRRFLREKDVPCNDTVQWILECIDAEL